jgi:transmembrane sensor
VLHENRENRKRELISQEAAEWFMRMQDPRVPLEERRRFLRWLMQSPIHIAEYLTVTGIDGDLRRARLSAVFADEPATNVIDLFAPGDEPVAAAHDERASRWRAAAAIAVCALAVLLFIVARSAWIERSIGTAPGEWKQVTLAEGSELQLGPNTLLQVDLGDARRWIELMRGEAYFKVTKDPRRPFFVQANAFTVRAVGTEFAVSRRKSELIVTVAEGSVRVAPSTTSARDTGGISPELSVSLAAAQQLRIADTWPATPNHVDVGYELAWREGRLLFRFDDTLAKAVNEFNLRNRVQLRLDAAIASLPVRGVFDASDPVTFARIIDGTPHVAVEQLSRDVLLLKRE